MKLPVGFAARSLSLVLGGQSMAESTGNSFNSAIRHFEGAEANLGKLERILNQATKLVPSGICFGRNPDYEELARSYDDVLAALPEISGWKPSTPLVDLDALAQARLDFEEIGDPLLPFDDEADVPERELADYRYRLVKSRRQLIRNAIPSVVGRIDSVIALLSEANDIDTDNLNDKVTHSSFEELVDLIQEVEATLGSVFPRPACWPDLRRHLRFAEMVDLRDIIDKDWPSARSHLMEALYDQNEPVPVAVADLDDLAASPPPGRISTKLHWDRLDPEDFERLIFLLVSTTPGYENPDWLMRTNAPDRGRDLSVTRVVDDRLGGVMRSRAIIQCKHWQERSIAVKDVAECKEQMQLWEPPRVDVLILATSGRFTSDAVALIERTNAGDGALRLEMWADSRLERLLAERTDLIAEFRLR